MIELLIALAIIGFMTVSITKLYMNGINSWRFTQAKLQVSTEAKLTMAAMTKFVESANGTSICISRADANQPACSYISAILNETIYITDTQTKCCGQGSSNYITIGNVGAPVEVYQNMNNLVIESPVPIPNTDITDPNVAHYTPSYVTLSANLDSIQFSFDDSTRGDAVMINAKFSKMISPGNIYSVDYKKTVVIKHMHSAGYYGNTN